MAAFYSRINHGLMVMAREAAVWQGWPGKIKDILAL